MHFSLSLLKNKCIFCLFLMAIPGIRSYGQRVYADAEQHSAKETLLGLGIVTLSEVSDTLNPVDISNFNDASSIKVNVGLSLGSVIGSPAYQNLQFTGDDKPDAASPVTFKFEKNTSLASVLNGFSFQLTHNNALTGVQNLDATFISLLTSLANNAPVEFTYSDPDIPYDGVRITSHLPGGVSLSAFVEAKYYYAFFIATPKINDTTISGCTDSLTFTLQNTNTAGIWYKLYTDTSGYAAGTGTPVDSFLHDYTLNNAVLPAENTTKTYYIIAADHNTPGKTYYSAWKKFTVTRSALPAAPVVAGDTTCSGAPAVLGINAAPGFTYNVYDAASGGTWIGLASSSSFILPVIATNITLNKTYYVSATATATGCSSASRTGAAITIHALPPPPDITID